MKKKPTNYAPHLLIGLFAFCVLVSWPGCFRSKPCVTITHPTEYHFNVDNTGYDIYTEDMKLVGRINYGENPTLDSLIDKDNE